MRFVSALVLVIVLIAADLRFNSLDASRGVLNTIATPIYWLADLPSRIGDWTDTHVRGRAYLVEENERLTQENLLLQGRSSQMASVQAENVRLRALLNSKREVADEVLVAELIGVSPDPARHQLVLNKGRTDGVFVGQPLIDADGLMGQVVEVSEVNARALLLTDATHSVPVQVNRSGVRAIAEGTSALGTLAIHHVSATTDIREGDLLVTSGLGGRFPVGYPVAVVSKVERDPGESFARVEAVPTAALDRSRHVLLIFKGEDQ